METRPVSLGIIWELGVKNYSGKVEVRGENYFHLDVVSHPNQQILGHCTNPIASYVLGSTPAIVLCCQLLRLDYTTLNLFLDNQCE